MKHRNIELLGIGFLVFGMVMMVTAFYTAYSNDSKSVTIYIDKYNEGNLEAFVVIPFTAFIGIITGITLFRRNLEKFSKNRKIYKERRL